MREAEPNELRNSQTCWYAYGAENSNIFKLMVGVQRKNEEPTIEKIGPEGSTFAGIFVP